MLKIFRARLIAFALLFIASAIPWVMYAFLHDDPSYEFRTDLMLALTAATAFPFAAAATAIGIRTLRTRFRAPDVVIVVTPRSTPLEAKFLEQDRRLERRERLKGDLFKLNSEIETFAANLTPDERKAWQNRPGPYGK